MEDIKREMPVAALSVAQFEKLIVSIVSKLKSDEKKQSTPNKGRKLSIDEAVEYLWGKGIRLSKRTIYGMTSNRQIPHSKFGKTVLFSPDELDQFVESQLSHKETR